MTPTHIELMVDRLCGLFPRDNIARNTVKNAWTRDEFLLLNTYDDEVKGVLAVLENDKTYPSLARVKEVFRNNKKTVVYDGPVCEICDNCGWDDGSRWETQGKNDKGEDNYVMVNDFFRQIDILGFETTYVKKCSCQLVS
jgi:hypothetical protein